jgi:hypothetical protein
MVNYEIGEERNNGSRTEERTWAGRVEGAVSCHGFGYIAAAFWFRDTVARGVGR